MRGQWVACMRLGTDFSNGELLYQILPAHLYRTWSHDHWLPGTGILNTNYIKQCTPRSQGTDHQTGFGASGRFRGTHHGTSVVMHSEYDLDIHRSQVATDCCCLVCRKGNTSQATCALTPGWQTTCGSATVSELCQKLLQQQSSSRRRSVVGLYLECIHGWEQHQLGIHGSLPQLHPTWATILCSVSEHLQQDVPMLPDSEESFQMLLPGMSGACRGRSGWPPRAVDSAGVHLLPDHHDDHHVHPNKEGAGAGQPCQADSFAPPKTGDTYTTYINSASHSFRIRLLLFWFTSSSFNNCDANSY